MIDGGAEGGQEMRGKESGVENAVRHLELLMGEEALEEVLRAEAAGRRTWHFFLIKLIILSQTTTGFPLLAF